MAVKLRLRREGKKKQPFYRVVVADARSPRDGRYIEDIGYYQPLHDPSTIKIDSERALYWLRNGAQPTDAVLQLLRVQGIWEQFKPGDKGRDPRPAAVEAAEKARAKAAGQAGASAKTAGAGGEAAAQAAASAPADQAPAEAVEQAREEVSQPAQATDEAASESPESDAQASADDDQEPSS
ncbi:MAG TPA: 30S ribosomal protein S16 [Egibacteraceae bacterium]